MRVALPLWLAVLGCAAPPSPSPSPPATPDAAGSDELRIWGPPPDAAALRAEYGARDDFAELCEHDRPLREASDLIDAEDWPALLALSDPFLTRCPVDIDFHLIQAIALSELGREAEAEPHHLWRRALIESVLDSGDGDSAESPWIVISVAEEYSVLRALGMRLEQQALIDGGIDALTVTVDGETRSIYFLPAAHWERMMREYAD